jgi:hypothetical protein
MRISEAKDEELHFARGENEDYSRRFTAIT